MLASVNAQEEEVPAVPEVPSISEDKEEEKVIKVEIVKNSSFESPEVLGEREIKLVVTDILFVPGLHGYYEKIVDENSSFGFGVLTALDDSVVGSKSTICFFTILSFVFLKQARFWSTRLLYRIIQLFC